jgi:uridine kinase
LIYYPFAYHFKEIDILLIEGIFLFSKDFLSYYDWKAWIDCSFETALQRAITRNVERLNEQQLIRDYNKCYYPSQQYHFKKDDPKAAADFIFDNN